MLGCPVGGIGGRGGGGMRGCGWGWGCRVGGYTFCEFYSLLSPSGEGKRAFCYVVQCNCMCVCTVGNKE